MPFLMSVGWAPVSSATLTMISGEVIAARKSATNALEPPPPRYGLTVEVPSTVGAATVAVASCRDPCLSCQATTPPAASSGTSTRIHSRRRMTLK